MNWTDFAAIARIRALEEADEAGMVWTTEARRSATHVAAGKARNNPSLFLLHRQRLLKEEVKSHPLLSALPVAHAPGWLVGVTWAAALVAGSVLAGLGQEREINLLALPLMGILVWNAVVIVWSLLTAFSKPKAVEEEPWLSRMLRKVSAGSRSVDHAALPKANPRFGLLVGGVSLHRLTLRAHAWLHVAAAMLALGSVVTMYARGWSREYRAVWESSLLSDSGASTFFGGLFRPASALTGVTIPLERLPVMRRGLERPASQPDEARPWIHLYAGTLAIFVMIPRLLLAALEAWRARGIAAAELRTPEWQTYARRLMSYAAVGNATARVLVLGLTVDDDAQARWRTWLRGRGADIGPLRLETMKVGTEADFASRWQITSEPAMLVVNAALTPEHEVHRELVEELSRKLGGGKNSAPPLIVAVDETELRKRWAGYGDVADRLKNRVASWKEVLRGLPVDWI